MIMMLGAGGVKECISAINMAARVKDVCTCLRSMYQKISNRQLAVVTNNNNDRSTVRSS